MHGKLPILGYRFGKLAYITDMKTIDDAELPYLEGVETLVVNALRWEHTHHSHQLIADAIAFSRNDWCQAHLPHPPHPPYSVYMKRHRRNSLKMSSSHTMGLKWMLDVEC